MCMIRCYRNLNLDRSYKYKVYDPNNEIYISDKRLMLHLENYIKYTERLIRDSNK